MSFFCLQFMSSSVHTKTFTLILIAKAQVNLMFNGMFLSYNYANFLSQTDALTTILII